jgi:hypothetical protein
MKLNERLESAEEVPKIPPTNCGTLHINIQVVEDIVGAE